MPAGLQYSTSITASSSGGSVSFAVPGATGINFKAWRVTVINDGSSGAVYVNFTTTTGATTGDWAVRAGSSEAVTITAARGSYTGLSYVSSSGAAPVFRVLALG